MRVKATLSPIRYTPLMHQHRLGLFVMRQDGSIRAKVTAPIPGIRSGRLRARPWSLSVMVPGDLQSGERLLIAVDHPSKQ